MRRLPILAVLLAVPAALRDGDHVPQGVVPEGLGDGPRESDQAKPDLSDIEPAFGRIGTTAVAAVEHVRAISAPQPVEHAEPLTSPIPEPDFSMTGRSGLVLAETFDSETFDEDLPRLEPAVLIRPAPGIDAAFADESDALPAPGFNPLMPIAPSAAAPDILQLTPPLAEAEVRPSANPALVPPVEQMQADLPAPAPTTAYELSEFDRRSAALVNRSNAESSLSGSKLADDALDALDAPMPPRGGGAGEGEKNVFDGDFLIVAAGAVALPSYEGSNDTVIIPAGGVAGRLGGIGINARAAGIALDVVPDGDGAKVGVGLGPVVRYRTNRSGKINDPVVASLGKLKGVLEFGVAASVTVKRVLSEHDQLTLGADMRWDISGRGSGYIVTPSLSYLTPLSRAQVAGLLITAEFADGRFAHYNYDVTAAGSVLSGLPAYSARGGLKAASIGFFTARDLNGNLLDGGLALAVGAMYGRVYGSAAETPITSVRGRRSQWTAGVGLGYVF